MHPRVLKFRISLSITICVCLLLTAVGPLVVSDASQSRSVDRMGRPKPGKPEGVWPDLDQIRQETQIEREAPPPIPSTIRSPRPYRTGDSGPIHASTPMTRACITVGDQRRAGTITCGRRFIARRASTSMVRMNTGV